MSIHHVPYKQKDKLGWPEANSGEVLAFGPILWRTPIANLSQPKELPLISLKKITFALQCLLFWSQDATLEHKARCQFVFQKGS